MIGGAFKEKDPAASDPGAEDSDLELGQSEYSDLVGRLVSEVDQILRTDSWALLENEAGITHALAGAALWHTCVLLQDVNSLAMQRREMALRIVSRAHLEAWLTGLYIHYGEDEALKRMYAEFKKTLETQQQEADDYDRDLKIEIRKANRRNKKTRHDNEGKRKWNEAHPDETPRELLPEIRVPDRPEINLDLSAAIREGVEMEAKSLSVKEMTQALTHLAQEKAPGEEHFGVLYAIGYRGASTIGTHPNVNVLGSYLRGGEDSHFIRIAEEVHTPSYASTSRYSSLPSTALLAHRVLARRGCESQVAIEVLRRFE
jgi:hypothetical protein